MKPTIRFIALFILLIASACSSPAPPTTHTQAVSKAVSPTETTAPTATATLEPSLTPTQAVLDLEVLEWFEYLSPNRVDLSNTDTTINVLVHNPNDFPVTVNTSEMEFRLVNAAGEVVYTVGSSYFSLWEGSWMTPGDSTGFEICACFQNMGIETQKWESIELVAPIQPATDVVYITDVEAILGEPFDIAEAHLGGSGTGIPITMTNASDQPLESIPMRIIARDASGRYIGMAAFGNSVVSFTENISIQPGESLYGSNVSDVEFFDGPLSYEVAAIGIPFKPMEAVALPSGTPLAEWNGIPIMPGAISGEAADGGYQFTTAAHLAEITAFYETELTNLGFEFELTVDENAGYAILEFQKEGTSGIVAIAQLGGDLNGVAITINT